MRTTTMLTLPPSPSNSGEKEVVEFLTEREEQIMALLLNPAYDANRVAETLSISRWTVNDHLKTIYSKLGETSLRPALQRFTKLYPKYLGEMIRFYIS